MSEILSRLYHCKILHERYSPKPHRFVYRYFLFCLNLDEIDALARRSLLFGTSIWNVFRFVPSDFFLGSKAQSPIDLKSEIVEYARSKGTHDIKRIEILGHIRTFGYSYNPACFYFCYGETSQLTCVILEVTNTFRERKTYFVSVSSAQDKVSEGSQQKLFYVSPFVPLTSVFEFWFRNPAKKLSLRIDSRVERELVVRSVLSGVDVGFSDKRLFLYAIRYPIVSFVTMLRIHIQAFRLYLKRVPYSKKSEFSNLQKGGHS